MLRRDDMTTSPDTERTASPRIDLARTCTMGEVEAVLRFHLSALWAEPSQAPSLAPLMVWGPPGVGKSAVVRDLCQRESIGFVDVRLAQREPVDIRGLPVPRDDGVHWLTSAEWPREGRGIILFDELTAADRTLQVAAYEFILDRRLGDLYQVPAGWYLCAAGNRSEDHAVVTGMSSALANRFCHLEVAADIDDWVRWATTHGVHPLVVGFLRFRPALLYAPEGDLQQGWPTPRSWERVSLEMMLSERYDLAEQHLRLIIQGLVGPAATTELFAYRSWAERLPAVQAMLAGQRPVEVPSRPDQLYALCTAAVHFTQKDPALLDGLLDLGLALSSDFAAMTLVDYLNAAGADEVGERARRVFAHPRFGAWKDRHGPAFRARFASLSHD